MLHTKPNVKWLELSSEEDLMQTIEDTQNAFVEPMDLGEGIALNEALRENLFMLLVSIMNQIPILVIGKPGCSKSLAMEVLQNNLNDEVSSEKFFKSMPAMEVFPYQCSPLSTPKRSRALSMQRGSTEWRGPGQSCAFKNRQPQPG